MTRFAPLLFALAALGTAATAQERIETAPVETADAFAQAGCHDTAFLYRIAGKEAELEALRERVGLKKGHLWRLQSVLLA